MTELQYSLAYIHLSKRKISVKQKPWLAVNKHDITSPTPGLLLSCLIWLKRFSGPRLRRSDWHMLLQPTCLWRAPFPLCTPWSCSVLPSESWSLSALRRWPRSCLPYTGWPGQLYSQGWPSTQDRYRYRTDIKKKKKQQFFTCESG